MLARWNFVLSTLECDIKYADFDCDGLIESLPYGPIINPIWEDSADSYIGDDGKIPNPPYKYLGNNSLYLKSIIDTAYLAGQLGNVNLMARLKNEYAQKRQLLHDTFWDESSNYYAPIIADSKKIVFIGDDVIDGLWGGIFDEEHANVIFDRLIAPDMFTKYGVRTRSTQSPSFSENERSSYHRGTVWGHRVGMLAEAAEKYKRYDVSKICDAALIKYRDEAGPKELVSVSLEGNIQDYIEYGVVKACNYQAWCIAAFEARLKLLPSSYKVPFNYNTPGV